MQRRTFMELVPSCLAGTALMGQTRGFPRGDDIQVRPSKSTFISIGHWNSQAELAVQERAFVAPEEALETPWFVSSRDKQNPLAPFEADSDYAYGRRAGDRGFLDRGVRVRILGPEPNLQTWAESDIQRFAIWGRTRPKDQAPDLPDVLVWTYEHDQDRVAAGASIDFRAKIDDRGLILYTELDRDGRDWHEVRFTLDNDPDWPALNRGIFMLGIATDGGLPKWTRYAFRSSDPANQRDRKYLYRNNGSRLAMAGFPYLVLAIDYDQA